MRRTLTGVTAVAESTLGASLAKATSTANGTVLVCNNVRRHNVEALSRKLLPAL